jgi:hypothetical protein
MATVLRYQIHTPGRDPSTQRASIYLLGGGVTRSAIGSIHFYDGDIDVLVNNVHDTPDLYRLDLREPRSWSAVRLVGVQSNRSAIGARLRLTAGGTTLVDEVRGGGSYYSQNDPRPHFGLGSASRIDRLEVRWPNGLEEAWVGLEVNRVLTLTEGSGQALPAAGGAR